MAIEKPTYLESVTSFANSYQSRKGLSAIVGIVGCLVAVCVFVYFIFYAGIAEKDAAYNSFMSQCIEWHSERRCRELYWRGRQDVGLKPPVR